MAYVQLPITTGAYAELRRKVVLAKEDHRIVAVNGFRREGIDLTGVMVTVANNDPDARRWEASIGYERPTRQMLAAEARKLYHAKLERLGLTPLDAPVEAAAIDVLTDVLVGRYS